jgi:flagellin
MISGLGISHASLATARQAAVRATSDVATSSRQIATGQRVASVKDDGATWARAAALKSQHVETEARSFNLARIDSGLGYTESALDLSYQYLQRLKELALTAGSHAVGSSGREALSAEWNQVIQWANSNGGQNPEWEYTPSVWDQTDLYNTGWDLGAVDPVLGGGRWAIMYTQSSVAGWMFSPSPVPLNTVNLATANATQLDQALQSATSLLNRAREEWGASVGADQQRVDRLKTYNQQTASRLETAIGSLTEADLGKASTRLEAAQTRQQLANDTLRTAITAYGNMAGGLLGNVLRTQRAVTA